MLGLLDLHRPASPATSPSYAAPSTITVRRQGEANQRLVSPVAPDRLWALTEPWNDAGLAAFLQLTAEASTFEESGGDYQVTVDDWLGAMGFADDTRERLLVPWIASIYSGEVARTRGLSARAALRFLSLASPGGGASTPTCYTLASGLGEALRRMVAACRTLTLHADAAVQSVRHAGGGFEIVAGGARATVDTLVMATPPWVSAALLMGVSGSDGQRAALAAVDSDEVRLVLHRDARYADPERRNWSFYNAVSNDVHYETSMWLAPVLRPLPDGTPVDLWKSWVTYRDAQPVEAVHSVSYRHVLPTTATLRAQSALRPRQGDGGVWIAGSHTQPFNCQETALRSALEVVRALHVDSVHGRALAAPEP